MRQFAGVRSPRLQLCTSLCDGIAPVIGQKPQHFRLHQLAAASEHRFELASDDGAGLADAGSAFPQKLRDRCHGDVEPAGPDPAEGVELRRHVEGKAMHCDPMADMYPDGGDLLVFNPDPGQAGTPPGVEPELEQRPDQHLLQLADEAVNVPPPHAQVDDRVADDLSRAVVGDAATALDPVYRYPPGLGGGQVARSCRTTQGVARRMIQQQQEVGKFPGVAAFAQAFLPLPGAVVGDGPGRADKQIRVATLLGHPYIRNLALLDWHSEPVSATHFRSR